METTKDLFISQLGVSNRTVINYKNALTGSFVRSVLRELYGVDDIFCIRDLDKLSKVYEYINQHEKNLDNHRIYSAAVMRYIRFLNDGKKYKGKSKAKK